MKRWTLLTTLFVFAGFLSAFNSKKIKEPTAYQFMSAVHKEAAEELHPLVRDERLTDLFTKGNHVAFRFQGVRMHFELVGKAQEWIRFNGMPFSIKDFRSEEALILAIRSRFGITHKFSRFSVENLSHGREGAFYAGGDVTAPVGPDYEAAEAYQAQVDQVSPQVESGGGFNFEGLKVTKLFTFNEKDTPLLNNTRMARNFVEDLQVRREVMTAGVGGSLLAATQFATVFSKAMSDLAPLSKALHDIGPSVGDIEMPR